LQSFISNQEQRNESSLKWSMLITGGVVVLLFLLKGTLSFSGPNDAYYLQAYGDIGPAFIEAIVKDRKSLYNADLLRTLVLLCLAFGILWFFVKNKIKSTVAVIAIGILMVGDLIFIDLNYVNNSGFVNAREMNEPFQKTQADTFILDDPEYFRVYEVQGGLNSARSSYFHHSIGGYHAAKPRKLQQLFDYQIDAKGNMNILNMLNVKYVIQKNEKGEDIPLKNDEANGNAWFVNKIETVTNADDEIKALDQLDTKNTAVFDKTSFPDVNLKESYVVDSLSTIVLTDYKPNHLKYEVNNKNDGVAVFSEIYYPFGWNAYIDEQPVPHFSVDYVLRAVQVPAGKHNLEFKFEPEVVKKGGRIALISSILILLVTIGGIVFSVRQNKNYVKSND